MISIDNTTITMTRGDTLNVQLTLSYDDGSEYTPQSGDKIRFALKKHYSDAECIIKKDIPTTSLMLRLESEETKQLEQPGRYIYDVQLTTADGTVDTFINKGKLLITEEVD